MTTFFGTSAGSFPVKQSRSVHGGIDGGGSGGALGSRQPLVFRCKANGSRTPREAAPPDRHRLVTVRSRTHTSTPMQLGLCGRLFHPNIAMLDLLDEQLGIESPEACRNLERLRRLRLVPDIVDTEY